MEYENQFEIFYDKKLNRYYVDDYDNHLKKRWVKLLHKIEYSTDNEPTDEEIENISSEYDTYDYCGEFTELQETSKNYLITYAWFELMHP